jgi:hypothetical protein
MAGISLEAQPLVSFLKVLTLNYQTYMAFSIGCGPSFPPFSNHHFSNLNFFLSLSRTLTLVWGKFASQSVEAKILSILARIGISWLFVQV